MKQHHIVHDPTSAEYVGGLEQVWAQWEPALRGAHRLLVAGTPALDGDQARLAELMRRTQYRAHTAAELVAGLRPPLASTEAHAYLVTSLESCRETLGVLANRGEAEDLDEHTLEIGLHAVTATRDAFQAAKDSTAAAFQQQFHGAAMQQPVWIQGDEHTGGGRHAGALLWGLVVVCATLFAILLVQVLALQPTTG